MCTGKGRQKKTVKNRAIKLRHRKFSFRGGKVNSFEDWVTNWGPSTMEGLNGGVQEGESEAATKPAEVLLYRRCPTSEQAREANHF